MTTGLVTVDMDPSTPLSLSPDAPRGIAVQVTVVGARVGCAGTAVLVAHGILVDRGVGLRCAVVRRWDAVTGLTAVITVSVIHRAVWIIVYTHTHVCIH